MDADKLIADYAREKGARMVQKFTRCKTPESERSATFYIASQMEYGCRQTALQESVDIEHYMSAYSNFAYQIADLLRDDKCELICGILEGRAHACRLAQILRDDVRALCPSVMRAEHDEMELRKQQKIEQKTSSVHTCRKCNARQTYVREVQTRSSDEAPSLAIQCANCGYCWMQAS
jgi:DNA-directed RNA polymerase subunit M/transcription elongation factor TFIIS